MKLLENVVNAGSSPVIIALLLPFLMTWIFTSMRSWLAVSSAAKATPGSKRPPTLPTAIPLIGHVIRFSRDGHKFLFSAVYATNPGTRA